MRMTTWSQLPERETEESSGTTWARRKGVVRFADETEHNALLHFCESDSNEHYGTEVLIGDIDALDLDDLEVSFADLHEGTVALRELGKTKGQVFPYKYKYEGPACVDHHIGDDGWSL